MASFTASPAGNNVANAVTSTLTGFTGGSLAELQDTIGDTFLGSEGNDIVVSGAGDNTVTGGAGADYFLGGSGADLVLFNTGDTVAGEVANGATGLDTIFATGTLDFSICEIDHFGTLQTGDAGSDVTIFNIQTGGSGFTKFMGGTGFDRITVLMNPASNTENLSNDTVDGVQGIFFTGIEEIRIIDTLGASNSLVGSTQADMIDGGAGNDTLSAREGNDTITGGLGNDTMNGGDGASDLVIYTGPLLQYSISGAGSGPYTINDNIGGEGVDIVRNAEFISFGGTTYTMQSLANAAATIDGTKTGIVKEDTVSSTSGTLTVVDPDTGQGFFKTTPLVAPLYGTFSIDANGNWNYVLNDALAAVNGLGEDEPLVDTIKVVSADNTAATITITIHGTNDAPVISAPSMRNYAENGLGQVADVNATDAEGDDITYTLTGVDAALFSINADTGVVRFLATPDFESPGDANHDNIYNLIIRAGDGTALSEKPLTVKVTDVEHVINDPLGAAGGVVLGTSEEDTVNGFGGNDVLKGLAGNDDLNGGVGADSMFGSTGADTLNGAGGNDQLVGGLVPIFCLAEVAQTSSASPAQLTRKLVPPISSVTLCPASTGSIFQPLTHRCWLWAIRASLSLAPRGSLPRARPECSVQAEIPSCN